MIFINEWIPNPAGTDKTGEWIELFNDGSVDVMLSGWRLQTITGKKSRPLSGSIPANGYRTFLASEIGISLRNSNESLTLLSQRGDVIDRSAMPMQSQERMGYSRHKNGFSFASSTIGTQNALPPAIETIHIPTTIDRNARSMDIVIAGVITSLCIAGIVLFILKGIHETSHVLFSRDPRTCRDCVRPDFS